MERQKKNHVVNAQAYRPGQLIPGGNADYMLLQQFEFPLSEYQAIDTLLSTSSYTFNAKRIAHYVHCIVDHTENGPELFETWALTATPDMVFRFLFDLFKVNDNRDLEDYNWTGYRLAGGVINSTVVWHFELFAKHPASKTQVITDPKQK